MKFVLFAKNTEKYSQIINSAHSGNLQMIKLGTLGVKLETNTANADCQQKAILGDIHIKLKLFVKTFFW